jgi:hypothetical protein
VTWTIRKACQVRFDKDGSQSRKVNESKKWWDRGWTNSSNCVKEREREQMIRVDGDLFDFGCGARITKKV